MRKILIFIAFFVSIISLISCSDGTSTSSAPGGVNPGFPSDIQLSVERYIVQTNADACFDARVLDGNGSPVSGVAVTFTIVSPIGTINAKSAANAGCKSKSGTNTDSLGYASASVFSSTPGFITVQAEVNAGTGLVRERKTVVYTTSDVKTGLFPLLTMDVDSSPGNGVYNETSDFNLFETINDDSVEVLATVYDLFGNPVAGESIEWFTDQAEAVILEPLNLTTNINGQAKAIVKDIPLSLRDTETFLNVYAFAGNGAANMASLFLQPVAINTGKTYLTADPPVVDTGGTSTITAVIFMNTGEPIFDGATINFSTSCGAVTPFAQTTGGTAEATFTAPATEGTCTITARIRGTVIGTVHVIARTVLRVVPAQQRADNILGETVTFKIYGGTPPYSIFQISGTVFPPDPATVVSSGGAFDVVIPAGAPTGVAKYDIYDAVGDKVTATLNIGEDTAGPSVVATDPLNLEPAAPLNGIVTITWDEAIDCATVTGGLVGSVTIATVPSGAWPALGDWTLTSCTGSQAVFTPSGQAASTEYKVTVKTTVTDLVANPMSANYTFSYTTAP